MAITANGTNNNRVLKWGGEGKTIFPHGAGAVTNGTTACTWNQGDLMCFDTTNHYLRPVSSTADAILFVGIADNAVTNGKLAGPYDGLTAVDASQTGPGFVGPLYGVVANMYVNSGDNLVVGCKMYLLNGGDTQTLTVTAPDGNYVGIYQGPAVASAVALTNYPVLIGCRYPSATTTGLNF